GRGRFAIDEQLDIEREPARAHELATVTWAYLEVRRWITRTQDPGYRCEIRQRAITAHQRIEAAHGSHAEGLRHRQRVPAHDVARLVDDHDLGLLAERRASIGGER